MSFVYDAVQLYDLGFGPRMVSVTSPRGEISPSSTLHPKSMGKAPGRLTQAGWTGVDVNSQKFRCHDYNVAKVWRDDWGANVGFVVGDGHTVFDNDQGEIFSGVLRALLNNPLRRYVLDPKHDRDAYFVRVLDFVGDGAPVANLELVFRNGVKSAKFSVLAHGKQAVIAGIHPGTRAPYAWERELEGLDQIPVMSADQLGELLLEFVEQVKSLGWLLEKPLPPPVSAPVSASAGASDSKNSYGENESDPSAKLLEFKLLLDEIPNRDVPPGEPPNDIDKWLDPYDNWISVSYASVAFLGAALAQTPEAIAIWGEWNKRAQPGQNPDSVWKSVLGQPLRFGPLGLVKLVRSLVRAPTDESAFPDLDPDDPALRTKTPIWDYLRDRWAYCRSQGFIDTVMGDVVARQAFSDDNAHFAWALTRELSPGHRGRRPPAVADLFVVQASKRRVRGVTYMPGDPLFIPSSDPDLPDFNFWRPTTHGALAVSSADVQLWLDHIEFVMGSVSERDRFLRWCAFIAQHPELKPNWHFLVMSLQGVGKDTLVQPIKLAVGDGNWKETLILRLSSNFNDVVQTKFLIVGETRKSDHGFVSAHDVGTRLKELLARPPEMLEINKKHQQPYWIANRVAVIMFSNEENPLYLERGQRRVHVVNRRDAKSEPPGYYQTLWRWLEQGGAERAASYILHYPLTDAEKAEFVGGVAPSSDAKAELEHLNIHPALSALEQLLADGAESVGAFAHLVATQKEIADHLAGDGRNRPSSQLIGTWLLDMEKRKTGVRRLRIDPNAPHRAGNVGDGKHSGRLWLLADKAPGAREWTGMTNAEIIALWKNLPPPPNATVHPHPSAKKKGGFPDDEEPI